MDDDEASWSKRGNEVGEAGINHFLECDLLICIISSTEKCHKFRKKSNIK